MRLNELPEIPKIWSDFLLCKLPFLPGPHEMQRLQTIAHAARSAHAQNYGLLPASDSVCVVANFYASLFGGPVSQILKCLTAIKICEVLASLGISATPLVWIHPTPPAGFSPSSLYLLDRESELRRLAFSGANGQNLNSGNPVPAGKIAALLSELKDMGAGSFDVEVLEMLKDSFGKDRTLSSANANWVASLMKEWDVIVLDPESPVAERAIHKARTCVCDREQEIQSMMQNQARDLDRMGYADIPPASRLPVCLVQSLALPVVAFVADPGEMIQYAEALPALSAAGVPQPVIWPQCSATILNTRNRRTLERYNLSVAQLLDGEESVLERVRSAMKNDAAEALRGLQSEVQACMAELSALEAQNRKFAKIRNVRQTKITYQLAKLQKHCEAAASIKEQTAKRKIHQACNFLAPNGRLQERELGGIQIPLRYSRAGLRSLYEKLDVRKLEHQFIDMD